MQYMGSFFQRKKKDRQKCRSFFIWGLPCSRSLPANVRV